MTRLVLAPRAFEDLERLANVLLDTDPAAALATGEVLIAGLGILETHPLVGRPAGEGLRELVISRGRSGYVALYDYDVMTDTALVLAIRHQREGGHGD